MKLVLCINIDGAGYRGGYTAYSCCGCPDQVAAAAREVFGGGRRHCRRGALVPGDHGLFLFNHRPALAITTTAMEDLLKIVHTLDDKPEIIDYDQVVEVARTVNKLLIKLSESR